MPLGSLGGSAPTLPWSGSAAKSDFVVVRVSERDFLDTFRRGLSLPRFETTSFDPRDESVQTIDEEQEASVARVLRLLHDVEVPVLRYLPDGFRAVREEGGCGAHELLVPLLRAAEVADGDARKEVQGLCWKHAKDTSPRLTSPPTPSSGGRWKRGAEGAARERASAP